MKYQVQVFPSAENDLLEIRVYFENVLKIAADGLIDKFYDALLPLLDTPFMHPLVQDSVLSQKGYHFCVVDNLIIFYKIVETTVQIHRFVFGRRQISSLL